MSAPASLKLSVEYLALDRAAEVPSECHDGEMFPIQAASLAHATLSVKVNVSGCFRDALKGTPGRAAASTLRVRTAATRYVYPDLLVFCGRPELIDEHQDTITNPKVIVEILSPSTANFDYGAKFRLYQALPSFEEYKTPDSRWIITSAGGIPGNCRPHGRTLRRGGIPGGVAPTIRSRRKICGGR